MVASALAFLNKHLSAILVGSSLALAAGTGYAASVALGSSNQTPTRTVTINVGTGETGPTGPAGPPGPPGPKGDTGGISCTTGFSEGILVINHPGGHTTISTCIED
ncbi:MAG TPA: hypothetical protein VGE97_06615 [Nitrososphaera sp.]|jgi:hypothetical protein